MATGIVELQLYPARSEMVDLDCAKAPGIDPGKGVCISNTDPFARVDPRELSRCPNSPFLTARGILFPDWLIGKTPGFGMKQNPSWHNVYWIGDAAGVIPPIC